MEDPKWMGRDSLGRKTILYDDYLDYKQRTCHRIKQLEEKVRIYDIQIWAAMKAQSLGLCKKCLSHAIKDIKALEILDG